MSIAVVGTGGILQAAMVFGLFGFPPGYLAGWLTDACDFRRSSWLRQFALSVPLSVAVTPILAYLPWRFLSVQAVWWLFGCIWAAFAIVFIARLRRLGSAARSSWLLGAVAFAAWTALVLLEVPDLRWDNRLYYSVTAFDNLSRVPIASQLSHQQQLPATTPFLNAGSPVPLRYHYFWLMICGLVKAAGGESYTARDAVIAGGIWSGFALLCALALYLRIFQGVAAANWRRYAIAFGLLGVTGLDIFPAAIYSFIHRDARVMYATVEWWNEQVSGWLDAMLFVPHHIAALAACLTAFLILWHAPRRLPVILLAAVALASAAGTSIYVTMVFGVFLLGWGISSRSETPSALPAVLTAGAISLMLALPFFHDLSAAGPARKFLIEFNVREFYGIDHDLWRLRLSASYYSAFKGLFKLLLLPLNYGLELGVYLYAGILQWQRLRQQEKLDQRDRATILMLATSVAIATFLRSTAGPNDLGFRGFFPAQIVLLAWTAELLGSWNALEQRSRRILGVLLAIGALTTAYDLALLRFYTRLLDSPALAINDGKLADTTDRHVGERNLALAEAYAWIRGHSPNDSIVQANPLRVADYQYGLYAERPALAMGGECEAYSGRDAECKTIRAALRPIFFQQPRRAEPIEACGNFPLNFLIVDDSDPVWRDRSSWVWMNSPAFANSRARVYACADIIRTPFAK